MSFVSYASSDKWVVAAKHAWLRKILRLLRKGYLLIRDF